MPPIKLFRHPALYVWHATPAPNGTKQVPCCVLTTSRTHAAAAMTTTVADLRDYASLGVIEFNPKHAPECVLNNPGVAFYQDVRGDGEWKRVIEDL